MPSFDWLMSSLIDSYKGTQLFCAQSLLISDRRTWYDRLTMCVQFQKFNPLLFAWLNLPWTEIRPKHNERVIRAQNKCHFLTQRLWTPLYRHFVYPYLCSLILFNLGVLIGAQLATSRTSWVVICAHATNSVAYRLTKYILGSTNYSAKASATRREVDVFALCQFGYAVGFKDVTDYRLNNT